MENFMNEIDMLEEMFENGEITRLEYADQYFEEAGDPDKEVSDVANESALEKVKATIQGIIDRIQAFYREIRAKFQQTVMSAKMKGLREKTAYQVYHVIDDPWLALATKKLLKMQDTGLKRLHAIYLETINGKISYEEGKKRARFMVDKYKLAVKKEADKIAGDELSAVTAKRKGKVRKYYKEQLLNILEQHCNRHEKITKGLEDSIVAYEKNLYKDAGKAKKFASERRGMASCIASMASIMNNAVANAINRIFASAAAATVVTGAAIAMNAAAAAGSQY